MKKVAERLFSSLLKSLNTMGGSVDVGDDDVPCPCRAVVVDLVVAIHTVLRTIVLVEGFHYASLLCFREVEPLLINGTSIVFVFTKEVISLDYSHGIVGEAEDELGNKIRLGCIEYSPVDGNIHILLRIYNP